MLRIQQHNRELANIFQYLTTWWQLSWHVFPIRRLKYYHNF
jgi:hypothetical protein